MKSVPFLSRSCRGEVKVDRPGMKGLRYVTRAKNSWSSVTGGCWQGMYSINLAWVWMDSIGIIGQPKKLMAWAFMCVFCGLNTKSYLWAIHIRSHWWASCSTSVQPCTVMSSVIPIHPWHSLRIWSIFFWKMSWEQTRPKGSCRKWYLLKGLLKVISKLDSWSRTIDQYPWWASNLVKKWECANLWATSSTVGILWWSWQMALLRLWESRHRHSLPFAFWM